jgi:hypothetical protein
VSNSKVNSPKKKTMDDASILFGSEEEHKNKANKAKE